ncbi:MAG: hypothetical protein M1486_06910 [Gammaproteobacteria bacterium]|nr:hypothetical protein [Gammaproteobacteria bacterium]
MEDRPESGTIAGLINFEVKYGKPGVLKYTLAGKKQIILSFSERKPVGISWQDVV